MSLAFNILKRVYIDVSRQLSFDGESHLGNFQSCFTINSPCMIPDNEKQSKQ